ncbi:MAG: 5-(carboxyamino)imidazole ribonucleotide mutase [Nitrospinae bacterium]|nr:5-(carboxyamino)imidazole ribonucleotide mutase [Nitrospinota bacterium]MDA1110126.1 5-(carboxyamino)imidazole ribonucleotide mutase [Nitrospinota bacterium]
MSKPLVGIIMGSDSDFPVMEETSNILKQFGVEHEILVSSAHRSPSRTRSYVKKAEKNGVKILIAGAGAAAHLAGSIAAESVLPVIGVPVDSSPHKGLDALLSTSQMPGGVPVATMGIGKSGAKNAGLLAVQILALEDSKLRSKLIQYKKYQAKEVEIKSRKIQTAHAQNNKD